MKRKIAVIDSETDPFNFGDEIAPFCWGFYDGDVYEEFWGDDCTEQLMQYLFETRTDELYLFAHNGGKFDFYFFASYLSNPVKIINGRIVSAALGRHRLRDSFSIIPVALAAYQKDKIDYNKFTRAARERNKAEILKYLYGDCFYLYSLVKAFTDRFGVQLTIGGTAIKQIAAMHPFTRMNERHDEKFRPYYFGGRCEVFEAGILKGDWKVYDVNSMYPYVMRDRNHCSGKLYYRQENATDKIDHRGYFEHDPNKPYFCRVIGYSRGALPYRADDMSVYFPYGLNEFYTTSHELITAIRHGLFKIVSIEELHVAIEPINFAAFVNKYYREKVEAKKSGDRVSELFAKFLLNSGYGKFGTNPANFKNWYLKGPNDNHPGLDWQLHSQVYDTEVYSRPTAPEYWSFYDVATAASITGAARAVLLDAMPRASRMAYCDTDSIICEGLNLDSNDLELGGWKLEAQGDCLSVAGKKMYTLENNGVALKIASKGIKATAKDIKLLCEGENVRYNNPAPSFSLTRGARYISREVTFNARIENHEYV